MIKITTNYSVRDWLRLVATVLIHGVPMFTVFLLGVIFIILPSITYDIAFLNYLTTDGNSTFNGFLEYTVAQDDDFTKRLSFINSKVDSVLMLAALFFCAVLFPVVTVFYASTKLPTKWIVKKLNIAPRIELVIFVNGKPW